MSSSSSRSTPLDGEGVNVPFAGAASRWNIIAALDLDEVALESEPWSAFPRAIAPNEKMAVPRKQAMLRQAWRVLTEHADGEASLYTPIVQSTHYCPSATAVVPHTYIFAPSLGDERRQVRAADDNIIYLEQSGGPRDFLLHDEPSEDGLWKGIRMNTMVCHRRPVSRGGEGGEQDQAKVAIRGKLFRRITLAGPKGAGPVTIKDDNNVSLVHMTPERPPSPPNKRPVLASAVRLTAETLVAPTQSQQSATGTAVVATTVSATAAASSSATTAADAAVGVPADGREEDILMSAGLDDVGDLMPCDELDRQFAKDPSCGGPR